MEDQEQKSYHHQRLAPEKLDLAKQEQLQKNKLISKMLRIGQSERGLEDNRLHKLHESLRIAMELELSTIPPYLCALYSIKEGDRTKTDYAAKFGDNAEVSYLIRSVMMEEMLHFTLVGNILNAVKGEIKITDPNFVPSYPTALPDSAGLFEVGLQKFSPDAIRTFLRIEQPTPPDTPPLFDGYQTIGQFYSAIIDLMKELEKEAEKKGTTIFQGHLSLQIDANYYYGGGGKIIGVHDLESALAAFEVILEQGEGSQTSIYDQDDKDFGQIRDMAHYFKFNEIFEGRRYAACQNDPKQPPDGARLHIHYDQVYNMAQNAKTADFVSPELMEMSHAFNRKYSELLYTLEEAFTGQPDQLMAAVAIMYELRYQAVALMRNPIPGRNVNAGPTFEFLPRVKA